jgi:hypothetical protein
MRLVGEDYMLAELSHLGLTRKGFRRLCRNLGVPLIICKKGACVDFFAFISAFKSVTRPGQPDFALPGSKSSHPAARTRKDDIDIPKVVDELVGGRAMFGMPTSAPQRQSIETAAHRLKATNSRRRRIRG